MKIAALGPDGTNGHQAALTTLTRMGLKGTDNIVLCDTHAEVFLQASKGSLGVVPVENSSEGLVADTRSFWLRQRDNPAFSVIGELCLPIQHCLLVRPGVSSETITAVTSHPQALGQCRECLAQMGLTETVLAKSTAHAAALVASDDRYATTAALASPLAAQVYGLDTLRSHMEDSHENETRFHVLGPTQPEPTSSDRTAAICWIENENGTLARIATIISEQSVGISSFHSLPLGRSGEYAFYLEFGEHVRSERGGHILANLKQASARVLVLGSYPQEKGGEVLCVPTKL